jgi:MYXO-CTERM domain-containing protein
LATVVGTGAALAQTPTQPGNEPYRPIHHDEDRGMNIGWIGLLGLAGLLGLRKPSYANEPMAARTPAGANR